VEVQRQNALLVLRKGDSTSFFHMDTMNEDTLNQYFDLLKDTLKQNNLLNFPKLYNVDETGIPLDPKTPPRVITVKGTKSVISMYRKKKTNKCGWIWECSWAGLTTINNIQCKKYLASMDKK